MTGLRILLVDDDATLRLALADTLQAQADVDTVFTAAGGEAAVRALTQGPAIDIVLLDIVMPAPDGITTAREIRRRGLATPIVMFTSFAEEDFLEQALGAGTQGFLAKSLEPAEIVRQLHQALGGHIVTSPRAQDLMAQAFQARAIQHHTDLTLTAAVDALDPAHRRIFDLLSVAAPTREIALSTGRTEGTVRHDIADVLRLTGCATRATLVLRAAEAGLTAGPGRIP